MIPTIKRPCLPLGTFLISEPDEVYRSVESHPADRFYSLCTGNFLLALEKKNYNGNHY